MPAADTDREWYELAAGLLRRVVPIAPPLPTPGRRTLRGEAEAGYIDAATITGGDPPEGPEEPGPPDFDPGGPFTPADPFDLPDDGPFDPGGPMDPADPIDLPDEGDPFDPNGPANPAPPFSVALDIEANYGDEGDLAAALAIVTRPDQATYTDTFDQAGPGPWWTQLRGTWLNTITGLGTLGITAVAAAGTVPRAAVLYNPVDYTTGTIDITLDNVTAGAVKYAIARGADNGSGLLNGYGFRVIGTGLASCALGRFANGVFTQLGIVISQTYAAGDTFGIRVTGTTIQARRNGAQIGTDRTDATYSTGKLGIGGDSTVPVYRAAALSPT